MLQEHLDQLLDLFNDAVCVTDADAKVQYLNSTYEDLTGIPRSTLQGRDVRDFLQNGTFDIILNPEVIATGRHVTRVQTLGNGTKLVLEGYPIFDENHKTVFCVTLIRDNRRLRDLQGKVQFQKELLDVFFKLSKSVNNAINSIPEVVESQSMRSLHERISIIARTDAPVLILGETGVGKDVLARRIHNESDRAEQPFIKMDCGSISPSLIETELFGYVGGTFSGANKNGKVGLFEAASSGTIFLDEIGELPVAMQTRLLRFLQDGEIMRVGATLPKRLDVRVIAATNKDLEQAIAAGEFRKDLYYRLKIAVLNIPPLRERRDDILPMARFFLDFYGRKYGRQMTFSSETCKLLQNYDWPGNVRELQNMVQGLTVTCTENLILPDHLPFAGPLPRQIEAVEDPVPSLQFDGRSYKDMMKEMEEALIKAAMHRFGTIANVAKELKVDRSTIFRKVKDMEKRGIKF